MNVIESDWLHVTVLPAFDWVSPSCVVISRDIMSPHNERLPPPNPNERLKAFRESISRDSESDRRGEYKRAKGEF